MDPSKDVYSHGHHESVLRSHKWRTVSNSAEYLKKHLVKDAYVLDVGCGPGNLTASISELVNPGVVIGIDISDDVIEVARTDFAVGHDHRNNWIEVSATDRPERFDQRIECEDRSERVSQKCNCKVTSC